MRRQKLVVSLTILLIVGVNSHGWNMLPEGYLQSQGYPQPRQTQQPGYIEVVQGTLDQLNNIDAQWICTNQKSGDMMVIGTDNMNAGNSRFSGDANFRPQQPTYNPQETVYTQYPQQRVPQYNPQQQVPQYNPQQQIPQNPQQQIPQNPQQQIPQNPQQQIPQSPQQQIPQNPQQQVPQNPQQQIPQNPKSEPQKTQNSGFPELPWTLLPGTTTEDPSKKFDKFDWASYVTTAASTKKDRGTQLVFDGQGIVEPRIRT